MSWLIRQLALALASAPIALLGPVPPEPPIADGPPEQAWSDWRARDIRTW